MNAGFRPEGEAEDFADVSRFLAPRSVAVVGASDQPGNVGGAAVRFFRKFGSPCKVYPVNRGRETVAGAPCYSSVAALPATPDLAILAIPARGCQRRNSGMFGCRNQGRHSLGGGLRWRAAPRAWRASRNLFRSAAKPVSRCWGRIASASSKRMRR